MRFHNELRQKAIKKVKKRGYHPVGEQHNGLLFVHLDGDRLHRQVVTMTGDIKTYMPREATHREKQLYRLT